MKKHSFYAEIYSFKIRKGNGNMEIKSIIKEIKSKMEQRGGLRNVFFVACGGSQAAIYTGYYLLRSESKTIATEIMNSDEFVHTRPASVDDRTIVVLCSLKATKDTVNAVHVANSLGAITIAMTGAPDTEMATAGQYVVLYSNGDAQDYSHSNQSMSLRIGFELLHQFENYCLYDEAMDSFQHINKIIAESKESLRGKAEQFANKFSEDTVFHVLSSGPMYSTGYSMTNCHFMEMQWKYAICTHSGEFFHGPFETTDENLAIILFMSTGRTRALDERALRFIKKYTKHYLVLDAKETGLENYINPQISEFFNSIVMIPIERYFVSQMAKVRKHSMDMRRYMWKVEY